MTAAAAGKAPDLRFDVLPLADALREADGWRALAAAADEPNPFMEPAMLAAATGRVTTSDWHLAQLSGAPGRLDAAVVLKLVGRGLMASEFVEGFWSQYGPLGQPLLRGPEIGLVDGLIGGLSGITGVFRLSGVDLGSRFVANLDRVAANRGLLLTRHDELPRPHLLADQPRETATVTAMRGSFASELDAALGAASRRGALDLELSRSPDEIARALADCLGLEGLGRYELTGLSASRTRADFARHLTAELAAGDRVRAVTLRQAGAPLAVLILLLSGRSAFAWRLAVRPDARAFGAAAVLRRATDHLLAAADIDAATAVTEEEPPVAARLWAARRRFGTLILSTHSRWNADASRLAVVQARAAHLKSTVRSFLRRPGPPLPDEPG